MFELLTIVVFIWLAVKTIKLALKLTWGISTIIAGILLVIALPLLIACLLFVGGIVLLVPIAIVAIAAGILKLCSQ